MRLEYYHEGSHAVVIVDASRNDKDQAEFVVRVDESYFREPAEVREFARWLNDATDAAVARLARVADARARARAEEMSEDDDGDE